MWADIHLEGGIFFGALAAAACWIICCVNYGFLLGFGLGWLPSIFVFFAVAYFWPVLLFISTVLLIGLLTR